MRTFRKSRVDIPSGLPARSSRESLGTGLDIREDGVRGAESLGGSGRGDWTSSRKSINRTGPIVSSVAEDSGKRSRQSENSNSKEFSFSHDRGAVGLVRSVYGVTTVLSLRTDTPNTAPSVCKDKTGNGSSWGEGDWGAVSTSSGECSSGAWGRGDCRGPGKDRT